jgi:hypothetical protein
LHPPWEAQVAPWHEIAVNLIGTWMLRDEHGNDHSFTALTFMNTPVTNYCEIIQLKEKTAEHVGLALGNQLLA